MALIYDIFTRSSMEYFELKGIWNKLDHDMSLDPSSVDGIYVLEVRVYDF